MAKKKQQKEKAAEATEEREPTPRKVLCGWCRQELGEGLFESVTVTVTKSIKRDVLFHNTEERPCLTSWQNRKPRYQEGTPENPRKEPTQ